VDATNPENSNPLKWGILGCSRVTRGGLIPGIRASRLGTLVALASRNLEISQAWAAEFNIPRSYGSYQELLVDPEVEAVYIPLPNELHKPWVLAAADAGKHVLCEKPLALDAEEARQMVNHCRARSVLLMEAFMWRHQPRTGKLQQMLAQGTIGELRLFRSTFSFSIVGSDWRLDPRRGGGALWDVGSYCVSAARLFAGQEPMRVQAAARFNSSGVDTTMSALLEFPSGLIASFDCSFEQPYHCRYELIGTGGRIEVPDAYIAPQAPTANILSTAPSSDGESRVLGFDGRNQYAAMVDAFSEAACQSRIGLGQSMLPEPAEDGLAQMIALESIMDCVRPRIS
jgi:D-xylose 1-dehydrogenase (NADP+, D-xylono-1,5-lactone-forming)